MKALSLWQPWASAIALGAKRIETRSWRTNYRGPLLIHAGKSNQYLPMRAVRSGAAAIRRSIGRDAVKAAGMNYEADYPLGAIIAVCEVIGCMKTEAVLEWGSMHLAEWDRPREYFLGDYSSGRYGWVLAKVRKLPKPIPYKGMLGLFEVPDELLRAEAMEVE